jgi:hypothetical protein
MPRYQRPPTSAEIDQQQFYQMGDAFGLNQNIADPTVMAGLGQQAMTGFPNANIPFEDRQRLFNQIVYANRDARIGAEQQAGVPRTVFANDVDRYNYRAGLSQQANAQRNFTTLQDPNSDPRQRFVAQTVNPLTRQIVRDVAPENFNVYDQNLGFNVAPKMPAMPGNPAATLAHMSQRAVGDSFNQRYQPINNMDQLNRSRTFNALPVEQQQQIAQNMGIQYINRYEQQEGIRTNDTKAIQDVLRSGKMTVNWETDAQGNRVDVPYMIETVTDPVTGQKSQVLQKAPPYLAMSYIRAKERGDIPEVPDWNPQTSSFPPSGRAPQVAPQPVDPNDSIDNAMTQRFARPQAVLPQILGRLQQLEQGERNAVVQAGLSTFQGQEKTAYDRAQEIAQSEQPSLFDRAVTLPGLNVAENFAGAIPAGRTSEVEAHLNRRKVNSLTQDPEYVWYAKQQAVDRGMDPREFDRRAIEQGWAKPKMPDKVRKPALLEEIPVSRGLPMMPFR